MTDPTSTDVLARRRVVRRGWHWFKLRGLLLVFVFVCGLAGFASGVGVSDRPAVPAAEFFTKLYYTVGLFVLGGMDLGAPVGGPAAGRALLWFAYFAAPAITATALVEALVRAVAQDRWWLARLRGHVVIAGAGRLGMLLLSRLRALRPDATVVMVDARPDHPNLDAAREAYGARVLVGDVTNSAMLANLHLDRAERVFFLVGDDITNLDAAARVMASHQELARRTVVHVSDLRFLQALTGTHLKTTAEIFNTYEIAATHLVRTSLLRHFEGSCPVDSVVVAGFGRFGQSIVHGLELYASGKFDRVVIVDLEAERRAREFDEEFRAERSTERRLVSGDFEDPELWDRVFAELEGRHPCIVLGSGNDRANLKAALRLGTSGRSCKVVARTFQHTAVASELASEGGFEAFDVSELLAQSFPDRWFEKPRRGAG